MVVDIDLQVHLAEMGNEALLRTMVGRTSGLGSGLKCFSIVRRSIDARGRNIKFNLRIRAFSGDDDQPQQHPDHLIRNYRDVSTAPEVYIIGTGPAGLFAALRLIELGLKPVLFERGKDIRARRRDLAAINRTHTVDPNSNYCFGEGGAGTYSDGKLYTRSTKRGSLQRILSTFVDHGANQDIMVDAHPHIGTNRLPGIIEAMRHTILGHGGQIHFHSKLTALDVVNGELRGIQINEGGLIPCQRLILAAGHSARDIYMMLHQQGILVEAKQFAMGVRAEHPQALIDARQYHCNPRPQLLPAASYALVQQVDGRGVYSFCMCPGGIIAPCATAPGEVVTNGWSPSKRNNPFANSGIVVSVEAEDLVPYQQHGPLAGLYYQMAVEQACCAAAGGTQMAPGQRLTDLVADKTSTSLPPCSYTPGLASINLHEVLPPSIFNRLQVGFRAFDQKMPGYLSEEALAVAVESRTSSPVRIPRGDDGQHPQVKGLFPCGEGAGYAGGIVSAAIDGEKAAEWAERK